MIDIGISEYELLKWFVEQIGFEMVGLEPDDLIDLGDTNIYRLESVNKTIEMINAVIEDYKEAVDYWE